MTRKRRVSKYRSYVMPVVVLITIYLLVLFALGAFISDSTRKAVYDSEYENKSGMVKQLCVAIDSRFDIYNRIAEHASQDSSAQGNMAKQTWTISNMRIVTEQVRNWLRLAPSVCRVEFWLDYDELPAYYADTYDYSQALDGSTSTVMFYSYGSVRQSYGDDWNATITGAGQWRQIHRDGEYGCISWLEPLWNYEMLLSSGRSGAQLGFMRITVSLDDIINEGLLADDEKAYDHTGVFLVSASGRELMSLTGGSLAEMDAEQPFFKYTYPIENTDMHLVVITDSDAFNAINDRVKTVMAILGSVAIAACIAVSALFIRRVNRRISVFQKLITDYRAGDPIEINRQGRPDEFAAAEEALREMSLTVARLISERDTANALRTRAELEILQAQINPHFLYNTLSSISTLAQLGRYKEMNSMMSSLSDYYRIALSKGNMFIPTERELKHAEHYIDIRKMQFGDRVTFETGATDEALNCKTLKVVLQPFIENVYEHAIEDGASVHVRISAFVEGGALVFEVSDDGRGATEETISMMNTEKGGGYGVYNVNRRLTAQFGSDFGVQVVSRNQRGLTVRIRQPYMPISGEDNAREL